MKDTLEDIRIKLNQGVYLNEEHIRFSLIGRVLSKLGWDIWNPKEVNTEYLVAKAEDNTKVDIALFLRANLPSVFIEIKGHTKIEQNLQYIEKQLRDYNRNLTATFTIITDGQHWRFYFSQAQGEFSDKCYRVIDLINDDIQELEDEFILLLSKEKIQNGEAKKVAEQYHDFSTKERAIKNSLSEANRLIDYNPLLNKVQAIQQLVKDKGYQVNDEEIIDFLQKNASAENKSNVTLPIASIKHDKQYIRKDKNVKKDKATATNLKGEEKTNNTKKALSTNIRVKIGNRLFENRKAIDTFIDIINYLGVDNVKNKAHVSDTYPLIIPENKLSNDNRSKYSSIDNQLYIFSNTSTQRKKEWLEKIAGQLGEKIEVKII